MKLLAKFLLRAIAFASLSVILFTLFMAAIALTSSKRNTLETERKAIAGDSESQCHLAYGYRSGGLKFYSWGHIPYDLSKAIYWYTKSANQGNAQAAYELASLYESEKLGNEKAVHWYTIACKAGRSDSCNRLVRVYSQGELGEAKDPIKAKCWAKCATLAK